jgi:hypothetical protein
MAERVHTAISNALDKTATSTSSLRNHCTRHKLITDAKTFTHSLCAGLTRVLLCLLVLGSRAFCQNFTNAIPRSYSLGDVLIVSAFGKNETPFTPLSFWNFGGWLA